MKYSLYSVRDAKVGFMAPQLDQNDSAAIRGFSFGINNSENVMNFQPQDFDLYKVGEFDMEKGEVIPQMPELVVSGSSVFGVNNGKKT